MREIQPYPPCSVPPRLVFRETLAKRADNVTHTLMEPTLITMPLSKNASDQPAPVGIDVVARDTQVSVAGAVVWLRVAVATADTPVPSTTVDGSPGFMGTSTHPAPIQHLLAVQV